MAITNSKVARKKPADYTEGSIIRSILKMGVPSMIGFLSGHIYYLVDMWWLARLPEKETAVAAVTIFSNIMWFFFSFNHLVGTGSVAVISRRYGEKQYDHSETAIKETFLLKWVLGMSLGIVGFFFVPEMLYLAGARGEAIALGTSYGRVVFLGMGFSYCTYSIYTAMRGVANPNMAMGIMLGSTALNMLLDPLFIFGYFGFPGLGIVGAAVASVVSYVLAFLTGLVLFYCGVTNVRLHLKGSVPMALSSMYKILRIGVPAWISSMSFSGSRLIVMPMIATFGNSVVAAYGVGIQISLLGVGILVGIGLGLAALIGHNLGGKKKQRAKRTADQALMVAIGIMTACGIIIFFGAGLIMRLYFDSSDTIQHGITLLRILAYGFPFIGIYIMLEQVYTGVGLNTPAMVVTIGHAWVLEIPSILILTQVMNLNQDAVWWAITAATFISSLAFYWYYRRGQWLHVTI
ncbi:MAG: MATE family efflux transporter [Candidatus Zixiibacteriota bacterium]|nr:MAG: MATE family efflux transporter [candidate division Zixibacteria bacterium]